MATYIRLTDYKDSESKEQGFFKSENRYEASQDDFEKIPGSPIAYWVSDRVKEIFEKSDKLGNISRPRVGQNTGNNDKYLRFWNEIDFSNIEFNCANINDSANFKVKWFPYNKGGEFKKWYGNNELLVNWENNGQSIKDFAVVRNKGKHWSRYIQNLDYMFKEGLTWSFINSSNFGVRYKNQ